MCDKSVGYFPSFWEFYFCAKWLVYACMVIYIIYIYLHSTVQYPASSDKSLQCILGIRIRSGPRANTIMRMRINVSPSCACACQLMTFLIVMDTYIQTYVHHLIQSLALMRSAMSIWLYIHVCEHTVIFTFYTLVVFKEVQMVSDTLNLDSMILLCYQEIISTVIVNISTC